MKVLPTLSSQTAGMSKRVSHAVKRLRDNSDNPVPSESDRKNPKIKKLTKAIEKNKLEDAWYERTLKKFSKNK